MDIFVISNFRNVVKKCALLQQKSKKPSIIADIDTIQISSNPVIFKTLIAEFLSKYASETDFIEYFKAQYVDKNYNWFEGASLFSPSSNNALEAQNGVIKSMYTDRALLPMNKFLVMVECMLGDFSLDRAPGKNQKKFAMQAEPSLDLWTRSYKIARQSEQFPVLMEVFTK